MDLPQFPLDKDNKEECRGKQKQGKFDQNFFFRGEGGGGRVRYVRVPDHLKSRLANRYVF